MQKLPLYAKLKESILQEIAGGRLQPGNRLPSQRELCRNFEMSHMTVRRAISELIHEGVIYTVPGKGLYVAQSRRVTESGPLASFTDDMRVRGLQATSRVIMANLEGASVIQARALGVEPGTLLAHLYRLRLADGKPISLQSVYLVHSLCPGILAHDFETSSLYNILRTIYHHNLFRSVTTMGAVLADREQAELLGVEQPAALLVIEQVTYLEDDQPIESVSSAYLGGRYLMRFEQQRQGTGLRN